MSRFLSDATRNLIPYVPGEQPKDRKLIKLNTNESPYSPGPLVADALASFIPDTLRLYPDMEGAALRQAASEAYGLPTDWIFAGGGSDEILAFAFMAFFTKGDRVLFPDVTYGFYRVYAGLFGLDMREVPLAEDFTVTLSDYFTDSGNIFLANPNAPTGILISPSKIEELLRRNSDCLVVLDEAYIDFSPGSSCVGLTKKYDNLLVVRTFSKSRALAGMRLALAFGRPELIAGLERIKFSFNPYNIDRISMEVAIAALKDQDYFDTITRRIIATRSITAERLAAMGFEVLPSGANFVFARHPAKKGRELYLALRDRGILVRHFTQPRIEDFIRITIGAEDEMKALCEALAEI